MHQKESIYGLSKESKIFTKFNKYMQGLYSTPTLNSTYNEVTFNKKLVIMKENCQTKYTPFTYNDIALKEKLPIMKQNLCIFFFIIGGVECIELYRSQI